jgi:hypothetical protein
MKTQIVLIAILVFLMPEINFGQDVNPDYNNKNYTVLPIDLRYFSGQNQNNEVVIKWALGSDLMNVIELEKSFNARDFETIATLKDYATSERNVYSFLDRTPFRNANNQVFNTVYYRLKQIDVNHIFEYSKIITVKEMNEIGLASSTPKSYQITAKSVATPQPFSIVDVAGKVIMNGQVKDSEALDIRRLPAGFYCLNIQSIKIKFLKN